MAALSTYYFVACTDGSALSLYYKSGTPKASQVILAQAALAICEADGTDPQLSALLALSDAFGLAKREKDLVNGE